MNADTDYIEMAQLLGDAALVYLGLAQVQLKSYAEAEITFSSIAATPIVIPRIARLWRLYAGTFSAG
jgi:hypothetical protein